MLYIVIYLPWFFFLEKYVKHFEIIHVKLDDYIPFCEYFIVPYLMWFVYVAVAVLYFFFASKEDYYRLCTFLFVGMTLSMIICTIWPNGTDLRPIGVDRDNIFMDMIRKLWKTDTATNVFPSIHVYNSIGVHIAVMNSGKFKNKRGVRIVSFLLMVSICLATVFLKQHSVVDGLGAIVMSWFMYGMVYRDEHAWSREKLKQQMDS